MNPPMHSHPSYPARPKPSTETHESDVRVLKRPSARWLPLAGLWLFLSVLFVGVALVVERASGQAAPGLMISLSSSNQVKITVTNAPLGAQYELQLVDDLNLTLDPLFYWPSEPVGAIGQTNFFVDMGIYYTRYFRVLGCVDCDGDGTPNFQDGQPWSTNVGALTIVIDSPASGANVQ